MMRSSRRELKDGLDDVMDHAKTLGGALDGISDIIADVRTRMLKANMRLGNERQTTAGVYVVPTRDTALDFDVQEVADLLHARRKRRSSEPKLWGGV
jgi:hypothetical protein